MDTQQTQGQEQVKIGSLEVSNVKRIKAAYVEPTETGLTIIGGHNQQGKTSLLDALRAALGGDRFRPSDPIRDGAETGEVKVRLTSGTFVVRKFTDRGSYLKVSDPSGRRDGQTILNALLSDLALDLGAFMRASARQKANMLLQALGLDLQPYEERLRKLEEERLHKGREADRAKGHAESLTFHEGVGTEIINSAEMVREMQDALAHNAKVQQRIKDAELIRYKADRQAQHVRQLEQALERARTDLARATGELDTLRQQASLAEESARLGVPMDTTVLEAKVGELEEHNTRARVNVERARAFTLADDLAAEYRELDEQVKDIRGEMKALLDGHPLPLDGLKIAEGELVYNDRQWDCMSGAEQLIVATAVCHLIKPTCGFVLLDELERLDLRVLRKFTAWLQSRGLQAIGTRVSTGGECSLVIEDGMVRPPVSVSEWSNE